MLDAYEDCNPADADGSLYQRRAVVPGVQAYLFNRPLPAGARAIPDGDFAAWTAREGVPVFSG